MNSAVATASSGRMPFETAVLKAAAVFGKKNELQLQRSFYQHSMGRYLHDEDGGVGVFSNHSILRTPTNA